MLTRWTNIVNRELVRCGASGCADSTTRIEQIRPGDIVWFEPGEKHWQGASPTTAMTHIAVQEQLDGKAVEWLEHVTDDQYEALLSSS
jgi:hypothetical protein